MKKIIMINILLIIILSMFFYVVFAANINITEDNFKENLNTVMGDSNNTLSKMNKENKTITFLARNIVIKYDLNNNPAFTTELNFNNKMTQKECNEEQKKIALLLPLFQTVSNYFKIDKYSALKYYVEKSESQVNVKKLMNYDSDKSQSSFTNAISFAKDLLDKDINFSDSLFTIQTKKIEETADNYKAVITLTVNIEADFSILNNYSYSPSDTIIGSAQNAIGKYEQKQEKSNELNTVNNIKNIPQTGKNIELVDILKMIVILSSISILIIIFNWKKYKKNV